MIIIILDPLHSCHHMYLLYIYRQFSINVDTYIYINVSVRNYCNAEVEVYQSSQPAVKIRSLQSASVLFWGWKYDMKTPIENIDQRSYLLLEVSTYQKATSVSAVDLMRNQTSLQLSSMSNSNKNIRKKTSLTTFSKQNNSTSTTNNNILNNHHQQHAAVASAGHENHGTDCFWGVFVLDVPKLKYFATSMIPMQSYPMPTPLNPTSRSKLSSHDYSRCLNLDIMLSRK